MKRAIKRTKIPKELHRCKNCEEYKGSVREKDLPSGHSWFKRGDPERLIKVRCICDGVKCKICGKKKIHRPCSSYYDKKSNSLWYVPGFIVWALICNECFSKRSTSK